MTRPGRRSFTELQVAAFRLARHRLGRKGRGSLDPFAVARAACGLQAQVLSAAYLSVWARKHDVTRAEIDAALRTDRTLVKTSAMRGTLHLLAAADFPVYLRALRSGRLRVMRTILARYGVTPREADAVRDAVVEALAAGPLPRRELQKRILSSAIVSKKARPWFEQSWWGVVRQAIVEGLVCYGVDQGREATLVRVDQWLGCGMAISDQDAQRALLTRYLGTFGPATVRDFAYWAGLGLADARPIWDSLAEQRAEVSVEGRPAWVLGDDLHELAAAEADPSAVRLLPTFDSFLLGHSRKDHLVEGAEYGRVFRGAGWISAVVLRAGVVVGIWSQLAARRRLTLEIQPFRRLLREARERIHEEAASLARFLEVAVEVRFR